MQPGRCFASGGCFAWGRWVALRPYAAGGDSGSTGQPRNHSGPTAVPGSPAPKDCAPPAPREEGKGFAAHCWVPAELHPHLHPRSGMCLTQIPCAVLGTKPHSPTPKALSLLDFAPTSASWVPRVPNPPVCAHPAVPTAPRGTSWCSHPRVLPIGFALGCVRRKTQDYKGFLGVVGLGSTKRKVPTATAGGCPHPCPTPANAPGLLFAGLEKTPRCKAGVLPLVVGAH